jgi:hypothetical protein
VGGWAKDARVRETIVEVEGDRQCRLNVVTRTRVG